jgi:hypothetical protein
MSRPPEIQINQFQLAILLDDEQKQGYKFMLDEGVFCAHCGGIAQKGIVVEEIYLTNLNDIMVRGTCNVCNGKVCRIMEFGEDKAFYEKATDFRKAIRN